MPDLRAGLGDVVHSFASLTSSYYPDPAVRGRADIRYDDRLLIQPPLKWSSRVVHAVGAGRTTPAPSLPGPWRRFEFELTPDWIEVEYGRELAEPAPPVRHDLAAVTARIAALQKALAEGHTARHTAEVRLPAWSPRRPFGVYVFGAGVEVRNVVVTPPLSN